MAGNQPDVLIVGVGPTGLALAIWLTLGGVKIRIIDKAPAPGTTSRAFAVQARTLEFYDQMGIAAEAVAQGLRMDTVEVHLRKKPVAKIPFGNFGEGLSAFPYLLILPQDMHERLLAGRLEALGVSVERNTELVATTQLGNRVRAELARTGAPAETCDAQYLCGCDGAHSRVRELSRTGFSGGTYDELFYVADIEAHGPMADGTLHYSFSDRDICGVFPLKADGRLRLIGIVPPAARDKPRITYEDVAPGVQRDLALTVTRVNWFSTYHVHHRVAGAFRKGRVFLLGDAAHIHSPAGGQGMNTGIGDAINLAWKLNEVLKGLASPALLDTYEAERLAIARRIVNTTDRGFSFQVGSSRMMRFARTRLFPLAPKLMSIPPIRRFVFKTISQIGLAYPNSPLSMGATGRLRGGDRMPWIATSEEDNFIPLRLRSWQAHIFGAANPATVAYCKKRGLPLSRFGWTKMAKSHGIKRDALYVIRPDGYIGLVSGRQSLAEIDAYLSRWQLRPGGIADAIHCVSPEEARHG